MKLRNQSCQLILGHYSNPTLPKWDFSKLKEIYVDGVRTSYIMMYNYKETKKKGQKQ